jgi:hypothetical protein
MRKEHAGIVEVVVDYGIPTDAATMIPNLDPVPTIQVGTTVQPVQTMFDVDGNLITVTYKNAQEVEVTQPATVTFQQPMTTWAMQRKEPPTQEIGGSFLTPGDKSKVFGGKVNSVAIWGEDPNMWLCTGIAGNSDDNGASYLVDYGFLKAPDGKDWDGVAIYQRPDGTTPDDVTFGDGTTDPNGVWKGGLIPRANFHALNL